MSDSADRIKTLEERVDRLEKQVAVLMKRIKPAGATGGTRDMRDRYDALDYPER